ncbi:hypothetical protein Ana3638_04440 [Anaerocolumna sedimenticola]|uniref:BIG2 domain-containing protein n=1 Tax=Anaerocolumna sedimenticola TaxID=2696063 RepID=A0A6P1TG56_9FIRM|nr:Ig-like domain-containing protein [Anaerocolumna sedimenticola]QHQ60124.1 hypothetical protein Ana3638_04440 [Anaerocolumna sedimenticola]
MSHIKKCILSILLCITLLTLALPYQTVSALTSDSITFLILSQYKAVADIGDKINLFAVTSNGKLPTWKSSDSKIASVNTYGEVTAKKAGSTTITAKIKNAEASCMITVNKTKITLNKTSGSIERGESLKLTAATSNNSEVTWKSSKKSIATIDENGTITGIKPGESIITAKADGSIATCILIVKSPTIKLSKTSVKLYRGETVKISADVSSKVNPVWKTNKKSVAIVDETGTITAIKNGTAVIKATVDGVTKICNVTVKKPDISLSSTELSLEKGTSKTITATVSSSNTPVWSTSNSNIVSVNSNGKITALKKGTAYVYASEDGTKVRCTIHVTE